MIRLTTLLFVSIGFSAWNQISNGQESYFQQPYGSGIASNPTESELQYVSSPTLVDQSSATLEELTTRLRALESKEKLTEAELKKLADAKKPAPEKPKYPNVTLSGVFQADAVGFNQLESSRQAYGSVESGADFRRARLGAKGAVSDRMDYFMQMDFGFFGRPTFTDVWADFKDVGPLGTVRV